MTQSAEVQTLLRAIDEIDRIDNEAWLATLDGRKKAELDFHNRDRDPAFRQTAGTAGDTFERFYGNHKYYRATRRSNEYIYDWIARNAKDKIFLDYACGNGGYSMFAA